MKKLLAALLATLCAATFVACGDDSSAPLNTTAPATEATSEAGGEETTAPTTEGNPFEDGLIIGSVTDLNADMMSGWTNGSQNQAVHRLLGGYETFDFTPDQTYVLNEVAVKELVITDNEDGSKTYTYTINENLVYNNGDPITAVDYVFSVLFGSSPELGQLDGASNIAGEPFVGYEAFNAGETKTFAGVRLLGDYQFSITMKAEELPNYFESVFMAVGPSPMHVMAPGVTITDDGTGATLSEEFTVELLTETILNPETGYRYNPQVTSGPYQFESYDPETLQGVLVKSDNFLGRYDGATATIDKLVFKSVVDATQLDELAAGSVHLIAGLNGGEKINAGLDMVDEGIVESTSYPRAGYGKIEFACEFGPTQFVEVRQAIAYSLDRVAFANQWTGGYGQLTHSRYGLSQWEAQASLEFIETELNHYAIDLEMAKQVLIDGGWTLNAEGGEFVEGTDEIRYKDVDGELMPLIVEWASSENNPISDMIVQMLVPNAPLIGMKINQTVMDFGTLLTHLYRLDPADADYHMFNLATGFATTNPVWYYFSPEEQFLGQYNTPRIDDEELYSIALEMQKTDSTDQERWLELWQQSILRFNELVIELPLYSDEYFEFFHPALENYEPFALWSWEHAILRASVAE